MKTVDENNNRKVARHRPKKNFYIVFEPPKFSLFPSPKVTFSVVDISIGGLQAQYVSSKMFHYKTSELSIQSEDGSIKIERIPFKTISDYRFARVSGNEYLRKCGFKFVNLSEFHKNQINHLIQNYI